MTPTEIFLQAREVLLRHRDDYEAARREFSWPDFSRCEGRFNWALDYFDVLARGNRRPALWLVPDGADGGPTEEIRLSFEELAERSDRVANFLRGLGVSRSDRILLMLPNLPALFEVMLAAMKLGAVVIPATTLLTASDIEDRLARGRVRHVVADAVSAEKLLALRESPLAGLNLLSVGGAVPGFRAYEDAYAAPVVFVPQGETRADDEMLLYFTSGTTARPKLVPHTHQSYPAGHLSTLYWIGLREGDVHCNISSPGWAKHAWSSFFAPWNAGATVFVHQFQRFSAERTLAALARCGVDTLCAPPTVWRLLILTELRDHKVRLREVVSAGEPLNPEVIERVREAWGLTVRDGYGQTETAALIGNSPGQKVKIGSMGRPLPGYEVALLDSSGGEVPEGEVALRLSPRPLSLCKGYLGGDAPSADRQSFGSAGFYRTGDEALRDEDGYYVFVGRGDDVFKSSDYRISPFELESVLVEHELVAEAAVVPSPEATRLSVPKAFIVLKPGVLPGAEAAARIFAFLRERLAPYKRVRRLEFADLPKTISGKIRRVELRRQEADRQQAGQRGALEFWDEDFR